MPTRPTRRGLLLGAAALAPASASARWRGYGYGADDDDPDTSWYRRRGRVPREDFYDTRNPRRGTDPYADGDPYAQNPYGQDPYGQAPAARSRPAGPRSGPGVAAAEGPFDPRRIYARVEGEPFPIPAFDFRRVQGEYLRSEVAYRGREAPGAVVVDPRARHLYLVQPGGRALRYGVGVGRQGFAWAGTATINGKQAWPDWYPPKEMIARDPKLARQLSELQSGIGMHGGPGNPLGARAMYLWQGGKDTLYRIHGTTEPWTIGSSVSSGCIRMVNQDAIDLYDRIVVGAEVVVLG